MFKKLVLIILFTFLMLSLLTSCLITRIPKPDSSRDTLLVVPLRMDNKSDYPVSYRFFFKLLLKRGDNEYWINVKPPNRYKIVHGIEPGKYHIVKIAIGNTSTEIPVDIPIEVKGGKVTIFPVGIVVRFTSSGGYIYHSFDIETIDLKEKRKIVENLREYHNFDLWEVDY